MPALSVEGGAVVDLDDVEGFGSSFLDEAFGGLVREGHFTAEELRQKLQVKYSDLDYAIYHNLIWKYITEARPKKKI